MVNINKVIDDIYRNGKYDAILDRVKKSLKKDNPTIEDIKKLVVEDEYYIKEYKDLNRWGELSSVHIKELILNENDTNETKEFKNKINENVKYLVNNEEYEVPSKRVIYLTWTGFVALPTIYVIDNCVRVFTHLYITHPQWVYSSFVVVFILSIIGYVKTVNNHTFQHKRYIQTQKETRALIADAILENHITWQEVYEGETI